jgi:hypothetical protein
MTRRGGCSARPYNRKVCLGRCAVTRRRPIPPLRQHSRIAPGHHSLPSTRSGLCPSAGILVPPDTPCLRTSNYLIGSDLFPLDVRTIAAHLFPLHIRTIAAHLFLCTFAPSPLTCCPYTFAPSPLTCSLCTFTHSSPRAEDLTDYAPGTSLNGDGSMMEDDDAAGRPLQLQALYQPTHLDHTGPLEDIYNDACTSDYRGIATLGPAQWRTNSRSRATWSRTRRRGNSTPSSAGA